MKVTIELPLERYDQLRDKCDTSSPEFSVLMNGCIDRRPKGNEFERFIQILCEKGRPKHFSVWQPGSAPTPFPPSNKPSNFRPVNRAAASLNPYARISRHTHGFSVLLRSLLFSYHFHLLPRFQIQNSTALVTHATANLFAGDRGNKNSYT